MTTTNFWLLGLIPLMPALGALVNAIFGTKFPKKVVHTIACGTVGISFLISLYALRTLVAGSHGDHVGSLSYLVYEWFQSGSGLGNLTIDIRFYFDALSAVMCLIITGVGFLIHVYSVGYMSHDKSYSRYFTYLNLFCFAMLLLVLGQNLVLLFVGWEGVGLASYLLIGFWFSDDEKASAGKKAFIVNRIGDAAFLLGMFLLFSFTHSLDIPTVKHFVLGLNETSLAAFLPFATVTCIFFFIGCCGKSAQIPLYTWLPDAMAGPTPVSALIHAATMVTAGVYLVARMNFLFAQSAVAMAVVAVVGGLTALYAASIAVAQNDIKKVLAYSTISQLGYMFLACGVGSFYAGVFHLTTHAFFKALLFLGAGSVIHAMSGKQDITEMGGLKKYMPLTRWTFLMGCLAIAGFPLFSGFFSKDEILWYALSNQHPDGLSFLGPFLWFIGVATAGLTAFYMFRLYFLTFEGECRADEKTKSHLHESPYSMTIPLLALAVLSVIGGFMGIPHIFHVPSVLHEWMYSVVGYGEAILHPPHGEGYGNGVAWAAMAVATAVGLTGIYLAYRLYGKESETPARIKERFSGFHKVLENKYYVDEIYDRGVVKPLGATARGLYAVVDRFFIDTLMVGGIAYMSQATGWVVRQLQNGDVQRYAFFMVFGLSLMLFLLYGV